MSINVQFYTLWQELKFNELCKKTAKREYKPYYSLENMNKTNSMFLNVSENIKKK